VQVIDETTAEALSRDLGVFVHGLLASTHRDLFTAIEKAGLSITQVKCLQVLYEAALWTPSCGARTSSARRTRATGAPSS
jgi:hypothetical protein